MESLNALAFACVGNRRVNSDNSKRFVSLLRFRQTRKYPPGRFNQDLIPFLLFLSLTRRQGRLNSQIAPVMRLCRFNDATTA